MSQFPLFTAIYQGTRFFLRQQMVQLGLVTIAELLPAMVLPPLAFLFWVQPSAVAAWLRPWVYSQVGIVGFLCVALPGRWHRRVGLAMLALLWIWGSTVLGLQSGSWAVGWVDAHAKSLIGELFWMFACSAFIASLVVSIAGLELRPDPSRRSVRPPRARQYSLGALIAWAFVCSLTLAAGRPAIGLSLLNYEFRGLMGIDPWSLAQLAIWSAGAATVMTTALLASRRSLLWLALALAVTFVADYALHHSRGSGWQGTLLIDLASIGRDSAVWWPAIIIGGHCFVIARLLPAWGFEAHSPAARALVQRVIAAAR